MSSLFCLYGVTNIMLSLCTCIVSKQYVVNMVLQTVYCQYVFSMLLIRCQYVVTYSMLSVVGLPLWRSRFVVHQSVDGFCSGWGRLSCLHYILAVPSSVTSLPYHLIMSSSLKPSCNDWKFLIFKSLKICFHVIWKTPRQKMLELICSFSRIGGGFNDKWLIYWQQNEGSGG